MIKSPLTTKLQLFQQNCNRVCHQHENLQQVIKLTQNLESFVNGFVQVKSKMDQFVKKWQINKVKNKGSEDQEIKEYQKNILQIREKIDGKQQTDLRIKYFIGKCDVILNDFDQSIEMLQKNFNKYLENVKQQIVNDKINRIIAQQNQQKYLNIGIQICNQTQEEIGILICEIAYFKQKNKDFDDDKLQFLKNKIKVECEVIENKLQKQMNEQFSSRKNSVKWNKMNEQFSLIKLLTKQLQIEIRGLNFIQDFPTLSLAKEISFTKLKEEQNYNLNNNLKRIKQKIFSFNDKNSKQLKK